MLTMKTLFLFIASVLMLNDSNACYFPDHSIARDKQKYKDQLFIKRGECEAKKGIAVISSDAIQCIGHGEKLVGFSDLTSKTNAQRPDAEEHVATIYNFSDQPVTFAGKSISKSVGATCVDIDKDWEGVLNDGLVKGNPAAHENSPKGFYWDAEVGLPKNDSWFKKACKSILPDSFVNWVSNLL